jgi:hypothetical protein
LSLTRIEIAVAFSRTKLDMI